MVLSSSRRTRMIASSSNQISHFNSLPGLSPTVGISSAVRLAYKCGGPTDSCRMPQDAVLGLAWLKQRGLYNVRKTNGGIGKSASIVHQNCCASSTMTVA
jgi:hypothetical protein